MAAAEIYVAEVLTYYEGDSQVHGAFYDKASKRMLSLTIEDYERTSNGKTILHKGRDIACEFINSCERSGVELKADTFHGDLLNLFRLWFDAWKRDFS